MLKPRSHVASTGVILLLVEGIFAVEIKAERSKASPGAILVRQKTLAAVRGNPNEPGGAFYVFGHRKPPAHDRATHASEADPLYGEPRERKIAVPRALKIERNEA